MGRFVGRENVRKRLAALEGGQGRTIYAGGRATIELPHETVVVRPPFGLAHEGRYETVQLTPLFAALAADHIVAALLVRLGGYAIGVFDGERIVAAKVGARFDRGSGGDRSRPARTLARPSRVRGARRLPGGDQSATRRQPAAQLAVGAGARALLHRRRATPARARATALRPLLGRVHHNNCVSITLTRSQEQVRRRVRGNLAHAW